MYSCRCRPSDPRELPTHPYAYPALMRLTRGGWCIEGVNKESSERFVPLGQDHVRSYSMWKYSKCVSVRAGRRLGPRTARRGM
ncbi:hypothetical protein E2C01_093708 [Portunus trituberculatus]|uniref:Uncharacterized protein n=1 Tax=Portunus trituberculatus TaxID=210409 RepID=A0A5B7JJU8_PORTR|nr:hypothetical protein [Portunus trituberculatus]